MKKYIVTLTDDERLSLPSLVSSGKAAKKITHARILLKADAAAQRALRRRGLEVRDRGRADRSRTLDPVIRH